MTIISQVRIFIVPLLALGVGACAEPVGDFGRRSDDLFSTTLSRISGSAAPEGKSHEAISSVPFALTDEERDLRNIGWGLVRPPDRDVPGNAIFELSWWRALPENWYANYRVSYSTALFSLPVASHETRYQRLIAQASLDTSRVPAFRLAAAKVGKADGARRAALGSVHLDRSLGLLVERRIAENIGVIRSVCEALSSRLEAYRYALNRLVIETPSIRAVEAEAAIDALAWEITSCLPAGADAAQIAQAEGAGARHGRKRLPPFITK